MVLFLFGTTGQGKGHQRMRSNSRSGGHRIAYFVSPHGFGHAARASAVMAATLQLDPELRFEILTQVPRWFFQDSLGAPFGYHALLTDIGLVQKTPLAEDLNQTVKRLDEFLPFDAALIQSVAKLLNELGCQLVICDIAPMGIAVASHAGIPSLLIENFTWDWIYDGYVKHEPDLGPHIAYLRELFNAANYRVQTEPVCHYRDADLNTPPVGRKARTPPEQIRHQLGIPHQAQVVMVTMGGIPWQYTFLEQLADQANAYFILPGADQETQLRHISTTPSSGLVLLPRHSSYFHPDLVNASDAIIGKVGYSTLAEAYHAGVPFGYIARPRFRESQVLATFIEHHMSGLAIPENQFHNGGWISSVTDLLALPRFGRPDSHGADQVARFIRQILDGQS